MGGIYLYIHQQYQHYVDVTHFVNTTYSSQPGVELKLPLEDNMYRRFILLILQSNVSQERNLQQKGQHHITT